MIRDALCAEFYLNYKLEDGKGEIGGIPHLDYTLDEYLHDIAGNDEEYRDSLRWSLAKVNQTLENSGIAPIKSAL